MIWVKDIPLLFVYDHLVEQRSPNLISEPEKAMDRLIDLKKKLRHLEEQIAETKKRLPAHSVKPPVMMDLLALEDEYEAVMAEIATLSKDQRSLSEKMLR